MTAAPPFFAALAQRARACNSLLCVGLDPHPDQLPESTAAAARDHCLRLITACAPYACAFKPNSAFFEVHGAAGMQALAQVIAAVPAGIPVVLDAKRGDIASTAAAYARAAFDTLGAHAITVSPYLGADSIAPFTARAERGVFVLCKTSNPGAGDLQLLPAAGEPLYMQVARRAPAWSQHDNIGLVMGATDVPALAQVRAAAPQLWFLVPGVGAQGGELAAALHAGLRADGLGVLLTVSRSIAEANDPAAEAARLQNEINALRKTNAGRATPPAAGLQALAAALHASGCVKFGEFTLKSGQQSPIYIDLRRLASFPAALQTVALALLPLLRTLSFQRIAAIPYAALPIGTAVALAGSFSLIYPRREAKAYGTRANIEGEWQPGETAVVLDDLITSGLSKLETIAQLQSAGLVVKDIVVLIDRSNDSAAALAGTGCRLQAAATIRQLLDEWLRAGAVDSSQHAKVLRYIAAAPAG